MFTGRTTVIEKQAAVKYAKTSCFMGDSWGHFKMYSVIITRMTVKNI